MEGDSLLEILDIITALVFLYCLFAVPINILRRISKTRKGEVVSPITLVAKKVLISWFIFTLILSSITMVTSSMEFDYAVATNLIIALFYGVAYTIGSKKRWSYSNNIPTTTK